MNKVISISLNGNAYQLEEAGYGLLLQYLQRAEVQLKDNPDKVEIISDLEQAIADKCANYLRSHKNVVSSEEIAQVIKDMGPVDTGSTEEASAEAGQSSNQNTTSSADVPKRLYLIRNGGIISGLCKGISVYFNIDVSIVRIVFVFLALITGGIWASVYLIMMFFIPYANTTEDMAAARGVPFSAQEVIDQAKKNYSDFKNKKEWRRYCKDKRRTWRFIWEQNGRWWPRHMHRNMNEAVHRSSYASHIIAGLLLPIFSIVGVVIFWAWMLAIISVATTGAIFGWHVPLGNTPVWVLLIIMIMLTGITTAPFKAIRRALTDNMAFPGIVWAGVWDAMVWIGLSIVIIWFAYHHFPHVQYFFEHVGEVFRNIWENMNKDIHAIPAPTAPTALNSESSFSSHPLNVFSPLLQLAQLSFPMRS